MTTVRIIPNLHVILAEKRLKLTQLARDTGLDYGTLHKLYAGDSQGIRFSTLTAICNALDCEVQDILKLSRQ